MVSTLDLFIDFVSSAVLNWSRLDGTTLHGGGLTILVLFVELLRRIRRLTNGTSSSHDIVGRDAVLFVFVPHCFVSLPSMLWTLSACHTPSMISLWGHVTIFKPMYYIGTKINNSERYTGIILPSLWTDKISPDPKNRGFAFRTRMRHVDAMGSWAILSNTI